MLKKDSLTLSTIAYLLLPNWLFLAFWFKPILAVIGIIILFISIGYSYKSLPKFTYTISWKNFIFIVLYALFWTWASGIGGYNYQNTDYIKHNILFKAFATLNYPIVFQNTTYQNPTLCYYFAYYLPVGFATKLIGFKWINQLSFLWGFLGILLTFLWIHRLGGKHGLWILAGFMFVAGLDILVNIVLFLQEILKHSDWQTIWNNSFLREYCSGTRFADKLPEHTLHFHCNLNQLGGAPQHALGGWLSTALIISQLREFKTNKNLLFIQAMTLLWSPFVFVGLLPFSLFGLFQFGFKSIFSFQNILGSLVLVLSVGVFLQSHFPQQFTSLLFSHFVGFKDWGFYLFFLSFELLIYLFLIWQVEKRLKFLQEWKPYLWLSAAGIVMATLVCMGKFNDFAQRVYIPSAFVFYLILLWVLAEVFTKYTFQNITKWLLIIVLLGTFEPIKEFIRHQLIDQTTCVSIQNSNPDITKMPRFEEFPEIDLSQQYLGKQDSFYWKYCK